MEKTELEQMDIEACEKIKGIISETYPSELRETALIIVDQVFKAHPMGTDTSSLMGMVAALRVSLVKMTLLSLRHESTAAILREVIQKNSGDSFKPN